MSARTMKIVGYSLVAAFLSAVVAMFLTGCGNDNTPSQPPCGPGTYEFRGICLPVETEPPCGPGTHELGDVCVADPISVIPPASALVCGKGTKEVNGICVSLNTLEEDQICKANDTWQWCYPDKDHDGWGTTAGAEKHCAGTCGLFNMAIGNGDCDDSNPNIHPNATEICDGKDNNCNGKVDEADPSMGEYCEKLVSLIVGGVNKVVPTRGQLYCAHWPGDQGLLCTPNYQSVETCDNHVDDNGDGQVDEGCYARLSAAVAADSSSGPQIPAAEQVVAKFVLSNGSNVGNYSAIITYLKLTVNQKGVYPKNGTLRLRSYHDSLSASNVVLDSTNVYAGTIVYNIYTIAPVMMDIPAGSSRNLIITLDTANAAFDPNNGLQIELQTDGIGWNDGVNDHNTVDSLPLTSPTLTY